MVGRCALMVLALFVVSAASAAQDHADHGSGKPSPARFALGSSAAVDGEGTIWAVHVNGGRVVLRRTTGPGQSWSEPVALSPADERVEADGDARPKIAAGAAGELYVTWTHPLAKPNTGEIRFVRSVDGGRTFSAPVTVHQDRQQITHRFDAVAVSRTGQVFVAWVDRRDAVAAKARGDSDYRGAAVYFAVSDDKGASFRGDFKVGDHSCECCRIALRPRDDGAMDALWRHVFEPNVRDHALAVLRPDGTVTDLRRVTFDDWRIDACPHHGPSLVADAAGTLHAVWFDQPSDDAGVFYGRLTEGRVEGQRRIGGATAAHADILADHDRVVIAWKEFDGSTTRLRALISDDGGGTWSERELGGTVDASGQPQLLRVGQQLIVFWNTRVDGLTLVQVQ
jgi:hypothetical protein